MKFCAQRINLFQTLLLCTNKIYFPIPTEFWRLYACGLKNVLKYLNDEGANEMPDFQPPLIWEKKNSSSPQHSINYFLKNRTTFWFQTSAYFLTSINLDDNYEKIVGNMTTKNFPLYIRNCSLKDLDMYMSWLMLSRSQSYTYQVL